MFAVFMLLLLLVSLVHLFFFVYNRYLLCIDDGPWKQPIHALWLSASCVIPSLAAMIAAPFEPLRSVLAGEPTDTPGRVLLVIILGLVTFWFTRSILWLQDRFFRTDPPALVSEEVSKPPLPPVPSSLPRLIRSIETTGDLLVHEREVVVSGLGPLFDGFRIVHVADVHVGQRLEMENYLHGVQDLVRSLAGDLVILTGDFVNRRRDIPRSMEFHGRLRGRFGTLAVLGNHDYWTRPDRIIDGLGAEGIVWLGGGERRSLRRGGRRLVFVGTDAPWNKQRPDFDRVIGRCTGDAVVLLSHTPDNAPAAARAGASLILSGHNHGGQMCLPFFGPFVVPSRHGLRYAGGLYHVGADSLLNVSRGVGVSSGGCRILCPPEITVLTLRSPHVEAMVGQVISARELFRSNDSSEWAEVPGRC